MKKIISISLAIYLGIFGAFSANTNLPDSLIPIGKTAGITVLFDGVMVTDILEVNTSNGLLSPAKEAGIMIGDVIQNINGVDVNTNEDVAARILENGAKPIEVSYLRDGISYTTTVNLTVDTVDGRVKLGVWVRDSLAGFGTITYVDPETLEYGALGHSISEYESGKMMPILDGDLVLANVYGANKGVMGTPGELLAEFFMQNHIGSVQINDNNGIYGKIDASYELGESLEVADITEVYEGKAEILSNVSGMDTVSYDINIVSITEGLDRNFIIEVTDENLLNTTGGIVQGMSGSPIIQNGKIIGAVTHVLINNPEKGFGISIENMLESAESIGN